MNNKPSPIDRLTIIFATAMAFLILFSTGTAAKDHNWFETAAGVIITLFFVGLIAVVIAQHTQSLRDKLEAARRDADMARNGASMQAESAAHRAANDAAIFIGKAVGEALEEAKKPSMNMEMMVTEEMQKDVDMLQAIFKDMGFMERQPSPEDLVDIANAFNENTGHHVMFGTAPDGYLTAQFSNEPFNNVPTAEVETPKASKARKNGKTMDGVKKLTASQQRRINASKGRGSVTDAEWKEQQNAKRRAARAAKKAEVATPTTTSTTTQPGKTKLVD